MDLIVEANVRNQIMVNFPVDPYVDKFIDNGRSYEAVRVMVSTSPFLEEELIYKSPQASTFEYAGDEFKFDEKHDLIKVENLSFKSKYTLPRGSSVVIECKSGNKIKMVNKDGVLLYTTLRKFVFSL